MSIYIAIFIFFIPIFLFLTRRSKPSKRLPPGSLGIPLIGQSLSLLRAMRSNTAEQWLHQRIKKYGPVSKLSLFGKPTVFISGQSANKLIFASDDGTINNQQVQSLSMIIGDRALTELTGEDHKRVRGALVSFLKPESLKNYVGKMEDEIKEHIRMHWKGKQHVTVLPLMKTLTFGIICSLLFGVEQGTKREKLLKLFEAMVEGMWSIPINLPFTRYNRSLKASMEVRKILKDLIQEKRLKLAEKAASPHQDLISYLLSIQNESGNEVLTEDEIVHNAVIVMIAGHDTSSILITFMLRIMANDPAVYAAVLQEQEEISKGKLTGEYLTWEDLNMMKYTWRVAQETLRIVPPIFGGFRKALKDIEFDGHIIPKGWQIFWATPITHMDERIFPEPSKFDPRRFENQASVPPYCFAAFGGGPRICPGNEFARIETLLIMNYLITNFTWKLSADDLFIRDPLPMPTKGLPIQIEPRKPL